MLANNLKFTKFDTSLVCLDCYLAIIEHFTQQEHTNVNMFAIIEERKKLPDKVVVENRIGELGHYMEKRVEAARHHEFHREQKIGSSMGEELSNSHIPSRIKSAKTQIKDLP